MARDPDNRDRLERGRMASVKRALLKLDWSVEPGPDHKSYTVTSPTGKRWHFWPYTGWFAGAPSGRGFKTLLKAETGEYK